MGKKSKKLNKILEVQVLETNGDSAEQDGTNLAKINKKGKKLSDHSEIIENSSTDGMKSKKKKRKHASGDIVEDTSVQAVIEERLLAADDEPDTSTTLEPKKKKKKYHHSTQQAESAVENTESENLSKEINNDETNIPKRKKKNKRNNLLIPDESNSDIVQVYKEPGEKDIKISKKKKNNNSLIGDSVAEQKSFEKVNTEEKSKMTKSQKKKRTGIPVLNAEESQVTEEDIDRFCDELDEEDNKQYEDWVKLIEASLPPPHKKT